MGGAGLTRRPVGWVLLLLGWVALAGGQYRMAPIVGAGPWVVGVGALLVGGGVLAATRSLPRALWAVVGSIVFAWSVVVVVLRVVSDRLGLHPPRFGL